MADAFRKDTHTKLGEKMVRHLHLPFSTTFTNTPLSNPNLPSPPAPRLRSP